MVTFIIALLMLQGVMAVLVPDRPTKDQKQKAEADVMMSSRYAWAAAGLLLFALVPTALNAFRAPEPLAGRRARIQNPAGNSAAGAKPREANFDAAHWVNLHFKTKDFVNREYASRKATSGIKLFARAQLRHKKAVPLPGARAERTARPRRPGASSRLATTAAGTVPVHVLEFKTRASMHRAAYVLYYGKTGVAAPIRFMLGQNRVALPRQPRADDDPLRAGDKHAQGRGRIAAAEMDALLAAACNGFIQ